MLDARNLGYVLNNEFDVQPIKKDERSPGERLMAKANARIELEQIRNEASEGDLLTFEDSKAQFAIRHLLLLTTITAIFLALFIQRAASVAFIALFFSLLGWGWFYAIGRQRKHDKGIVRRLREFKERHDDADLEGLDVNLEGTNVDHIWSLRDRE